MCSSITSSQFAPSSTKSMKLAALTWQEIFIHIETYKFIAIHNGKIKLEEFLDIIQKTGKYIIEDCTDIRTHDFIAEITKLIARYHYNDSKEIKNIADEFRNQTWQLTNKDSEMRDSFIRTCRAMCQLCNYMLLVHSDILEHLSEEDSLILNELKKHSTCKLVVFISDIEDFDKYSTQVLPFKFINMVKEEFPMVYISHHWDAESDKYVNGLCRALDADGIAYGIDKKDAKYRSKIIEFEKKLGRAFIVVPIINKEYLQSIECMYEIAETSQNGHIEDRLFPLIVFDIKRNGEGLKEQLDYWKAKDQEYRQSAQQLGVGSANIDNNEIVRIDTICSQLPKIWEYFKNYFTSTKEELTANNFSLMVKFIKEKMAVLCSNPQSPATSPTQDSNTTASTIVQTGDHAVNINNMGGNITINQ